MVRHGARLFPNFGAQSFHPSSEDVSGRQVGAHVMALREHLLAEVNRDPARIQEYALAIFRNASSTSEQLDFRVQGIRNLHRSNMIPKRRIGTVRRMVVENQKVANAVVFKVDQAVELIAVQGRNVTLREQFDQRVIAA